MALRPERPLVEVTSRAGWRAWLAEHHTDSTGVWAVTRKRRALRDGEGYVSSQDLAEECLCFGWIDSKITSLDDERTALLCTPRRPGGTWSKVNKERLVRLLAEGLVAPRGLEVIAAAQADGSWSRLDHVDAMVEPDDLVAALAATPGARATWDGFSPSLRRNVLFWISEAKRPATRAARIDKVVRNAAEGRRPDA